MLGSKVKNRAVTHTILLPGNLKKKFFFLEVILEEKPGALTIETNLKESSLLS